MCIYVYMCVYVYVYICLHMYVYMYIYIYIYMCLSVNVAIYLAVSIYDSKICIPTYMYLHVFLCIHVQRIQPHMYWHMSGLLNKPRLPTRPLKSLNKANYPRDLAWAPNMGPYLLERALNYSPRFVSG